MTKAPKKYAAQAKYQAAKEEARAYVQVNVKFKSGADVKMFEKLRRRFPDLSDSGIVRRAVKELASKGN